MKNNKITLGCDPELFLEQDGQIISAEGLVGGTKENPLPITGEGHCVQEDNVMVEFNIPPSNTMNEFKDNINLVKNYLTEKFKKNNISLNYSASAMLDKKYLKTEQAKRFGCEPDFNVWKREANTPPKAGGRLRSAGGHVHIGFSDVTQEKQENVVKAFDMILGLQSVLLDSDTRRRRMYGKAGAFRFKDFGVECRMLSNFWIESDETIKWVYNETTRAVNLALNYDLSEIFEKYGDNIQLAINESNVDLAKELYSEINEEITKVITTKKIKI
tara:strand:- start:39 stop:857 length:819 start_codon:yes stop_codon:yes gene_type:complete